MSTVHVEGISAKTSEKEVRDFFSFCGKINDLTLNSGSGDTGTKSASVTFDKETAAKTALLLDNTQLGPAQVTVKSASSSSEQAGGQKEGESGEGHNVSQEDKPRGRIIAEYLAHGYVISDKIIERALALDKQHGVSNRFTRALQDFDSKYKATEKARSADDKYKVTQTASNSWNSMASYFDQALSGPTGQKLRNFYTEGQKQVVDVHNEARHLANLKGSKAGSGSGSEEKPAEGSAAAEVTTSEKTGGTV